MRPIRRGASRLRVLSLSALAAVFIFYTLLPDGTFRSGTGTGVQVQYLFKRKGVVAGDPDKAAAVKAAMNRTFWTYRAAAWGSDEVRPITGGNRTTRNNWAATVVDTLTTTLMMGLEEEFLLGLDFTIYSLDFSRADDLVDPFETTIRYLGAMVSTVDLLDAGFTTLSRPVPKEARDALLKQALQLADMLAPGFDSPTGMMWPRVNFTSAKGCREKLDERPYPDYDHATIGPARAGSNWLENMALSRLSGLPQYGVNATRAWRPLVYSKWVEEWPGMIDGPWDIMTGVPYDNHRSWGAGHDSYYEYLIKAHVMIPSDPHSLKYRDRWLAAVDSTTKHLIQTSHDSGGAETHYFLHQYHNGWLINQMGHLACFAGGNWMLGGAYLRNPSITNMGAELVKTCRDTYAKTATGIGPENWRWYPMDTEPVHEPNTEEQWRQARKWGWWATDARYMLRPETVESYFYAYRITGDKMYQAWAWDAFQAYMKATKADHGYAEVQDVTLPAGANNQKDQAESFWGAETLKYLYLIFCDDDVASLDEWVFSTEAHPFRIQKRSGAGAVGMV